MTEESAVEDLRNILQIILACRYTEEITLNDLTCIERRTLSALRKIDPDFYRKKFKIYLDDVRPLPEGYAANQWVVIRTGEECIEYIKRTGLTNIEGISFDHDLGEGMSGYNVICWIENHIREVGVPDELPWMFVHSANPVGERNILRAIEAISKFCCR